VFSSADQGAFQTFEKKKKKKLFSLVLKKNQVSATLLFGAAK